MSLDHWKVIRRLFLKFKLERVLPLKFPFVLVYLRKLGMCSRPQSSQLTFLTYFPTTSACQWCSRAHSLWELTAHNSSQLHVQWCHFGSLKLAMEENLHHRNWYTIEIRVFIPLETQLLNIYHYICPKLWHRQLLSILDPGLDWDM